MPNPILTAAIDALASQRDLSADQTAEVLAEIMNGEVSETQIAAFLIALRTKGETVEELTGLARTMRALSVPVCSERHDLLDTAGTGGGASTFNVSTTAALIAAGAGCAVAKHGNRSATSRSGSADVLEALGARIDLGSEAVAACIEEAGFGFMFAPAHHQATRFVVPVRRELAVRTIFNMLGPLTNPAGARRQLLGVSDARFLDRIARALAGLGVDRALVVSSEDGLDEVSSRARTLVVEVNGEEVSEYVLEPHAVGIRPDPRAADGWGGGTPQQNAGITRAILDPGHSAAGRPVGEDLALINAGAAIYAAGRAHSIGEGVLAALSAPGISVIAEFKRRSPSAGLLRDGAELAPIIDAYVRGGAAALSILTEGPNFAGSIEDLRSARALCELPLLRKDFIIDRYQLYEARLAGADAVLLIAAALDPSELLALHRCAGAIGLHALVEVHDRRQLHDALAAGAQIVGINNRDLRDFTVDVERTERLLEEVPAGVLVVSESGIGTPEQLARLQARGVHAVLVGERLMRAPDPAEALRRLRTF